jgi:hypothetical protein
MRLELRADWWEELNRQDAKRLRENEENRTQRRRGAEENAEKFN